MFKALVVDKDADSGKTSAAVKDIALADLPEGEVTVAVEYSTVNYKDGLCIGPGGGLVEQAVRNLENASVSTQKKLLKVSSQIRLILRFSGRTWVLWF